MHQPVQDRIEEYLDNPGNGKIPSGFHAHLGSCSSCAQEVEVFQSHQRSLGVFKAPENAEPSPGFYARVLSRIEEQTPDSFLAAFLEPAFGRRLAIACVMLVLMMGTYLVKSEPDSDLAQPSGVVVSQKPAAEFEDGSINPRRRDAVLVNLASYGQ